MDLANGYAYFAGAGTFSSAGVLRQVWTRPYIHLGAPSERAGD